MTTTSRHAHRVRTTRTEPFVGPVRQPARPAAHGNICSVATCACGATRRTNINQQYREVGAWDGPANGPEDADE